MKNSKYFAAIVCSLIALVCFGCGSKGYAASEDELKEIVQNEKRSSDAIKNFATKYDGGRFGFIATGTLHHLPQDAIFGLWVTAKTQETIKSGRELALAFVNAYLNELTTNKDTIKWFATECSSYPNRFSGKVSLKNVGVRIAFWDQNVERPKAPFLAQIDFQDGKFRYYEADPKTQALRLVLEEPYAAVGSPP